MCHVPPRIRNIYLAPGAWVYGALIMDAHPTVKIFGRGVLSAARLNHRESHVIEALHGTSQIDLEGIVFAKGGTSSWQRSFRIENLTTETPVPLIFNLRPNPASPDEIHGLTLKNWRVEMDMPAGWANYLATATTSSFSGLVFDHVSLNGIPLTATNWLRAGRFVLSNITYPVFTKPAAAP